MNTPRKKKPSDLVSEAFLEDEADGTVSNWPVCKDCVSYFNAGSDLAMTVINKWADESLCEIKELPLSIRKCPLRQVLIVDYIDRFLNEEIRKKILGNRFPTFVADLNACDKKYFLWRLREDTTLSNTFLSDTEHPDERILLGLKIWVGAMCAAKSTRATFKADGGEQPYDLNRRKLGFQEADRLAESNGIIRAGVEIAPILELIIRQHSQISLQGAEYDSPIWTYVTNRENVAAIQKKDIRL